MVRIKYQLTLEEYREGFAAVQKRYARRATAQQRRSPMLIGWALIIGLSTPFLFGQLLRNRPEQASLLWVWGPHVFWIGVIVVLFAIAFAAARRQQRRLAELLWNGLIELQQPHTIEFDDGGVHAVTPLSDKRTKWAVYSDMDETPSSFLLFLGDFAVEIFPKRAFDARAEGEFRQLARVAGASWSRAFPVLPVQEQSGKQD
jgi:hypothetical protein